MARRERREHRSAAKLTAWTAALAAPVLVWALLWAIGGWLPQGDEGVIAQKTQDVLSLHPPLQGMRSTSSSTVPDSFAHHLGPMQFYLMAPVYGLTGWRPAGLLLATALLALTFVAVAVWQVEKVAGQRGLAMVAVTVVGVECTAGPLLALPWNVYPPMLALVPLIVLAWRLMRGGSQALPWFVAVASFVLQANLMFILVLGPLLLTLTIVGLVRWATWREAYWPLPGTGSGYSDSPWFRRPGVVATLVGVLCWLPPTIELFALDPNNAEELWKLVRGVMGVNLVLAGLLGILLIAACTWWMTRPERPTRLHSAWCVVLLLGAGAIGGLGLGGPMSAHYSMLVVALPVFAVATLVLTPTARAIVERVLWPSRTTGWVMAASALVVGAGLVVLLGPDGQWLSQVATLEKVNVVSARHADDAVVSALHRRGVTSGPVEVRGEGFVALLSHTAAVGTRLRQEGYDVYAQNIWPIPEDDEFRTVRQAPTKRTIVIVRDAGAPRILTP